jgi:hypothetical protein
MNSVNHSGLESQRSRSIPSAFMLPPPRPAGLPGDHKDGSRPKWSAGSPGGPDECGFRHGLLSADRVIAVCLDRGVLRGVRRAGWKRSHLGSVPPPEGSRDRVRFPSTPGTFTRSEWPITGQVLDPLEGSSGWGYRQSCHHVGRLARSTGLRFPPDQVGSSPDRGPPWWKPLPGNRSDQRPATWERPCGRVDTRVRTCRVAGRARNGSSDMVRIRGPWLAAGADIRRDRSGNGPPARPYRLVGDSCRSQY